MDEQYETTTVRLYLSALRVFLDSCVVDGLISVNPSTSVRLPRLDARHGKTPVIVSTEVRQILDHVPHGERATTADLRDRALIGLMTYSFFRISAALKLDRKDYVMRGDQPWIIGMEKGSKRHEMPVHPELEDMLDALILKGGLHGPETPLFQSASNRGGHLTGRRYNRRSAWAMVGRRAKAAGVETAVCNHTFRATGITTYLENGGTIEDARVMANHSSSTTTKLYDRTLDKAKADEVLKIRI
jgi:integrase